MPPQRRQLHDEYFKRAKAEGYLARSAYKLIEITEKKWLIKRGDAVLDLGCAPGSWLQVAEKMVGPEGVVVGIDLSDVRHRFGDNVHIVKGDIYQTPPEVLIGGMGMPFDVVMSDMAPSTSGHGDDFLSVRLCRHMIQMLPHLLRRGGHTLMKVLEGEEFPTLLREARELFGDAGGIKPKASRDVSREMFIWGKGYKGIASTRVESKPKAVEVVPLVLPAGQMSGWEVKREEEPEPSESMPDPIRKKVIKRVIKKVTKKAAKKTQRSNSESKKAKRVPKAAAKKAAMKSPKAKAKKAKR